MEDVKLSQEQAVLLYTAKITHAVNKAYCESIGDFSQLDWDESPTWQQESAIKGVQFILDNPKAKPSASHESWLKEKYADGWQYGKEKNSVLKTHPCCVPYVDLPKEQKSKDFIFGAIVRSIYNIK